MLSTPMNDDRSCSLYNQLTVFVPLGFLSVWDDPPGTYASSFLPPDSSGGASGT